MTAFVIPLRVLAASSTGFPKSKWELGNSRASETSEKLKFPPVITSDWGQGGSFSENVVVAETSYQMKEVLSFCDWERA